MNESGLDLSHLRHLQAWITYDQRADASARVAASIDKFLSAEGIVRSEDCDQPCRDNLRILEAAGYVPLGPLLSPEQADETRAYFERTPCYAAHVAAKSDGIPRDPNGAAAAHPFGSYMLEEIVSAPHILELANRPDVLALAEAYLGCVPTLYSMNAWWSFPQTKEAERVTQMFHRDLDDFRFLALFVYLTDVDEGNGPHQYIRGSHRPEIVHRYLIDNGRDEDEADGLIADLFKGTGYAGRDLYPLHLDRRIDTIAGPAGSAFLADAYGLHRGVPPTGARRLVCWIRYGLFENAASAEDKITPVPRAAVAGRVPDDAKSNYVNRLIVGG